MVDWAGLSHAYGPATDTPDLLRQSASDDRELVESSLSDLYGSVFHQGTVYPATVAVVPFLVELAHRANHERDGFVWLVGSLADKHHAYGREAPAVRSAVAEQSAALAGLLGDRDARVREAAAYAACKAGAASDVFWARWFIEDDPTVRASLLLALGELDIDTATPVLTEACLAAPAPVRLAAAGALLRAGLPWPEGATTSLVDAIDAGASITYCWSNGADWYTELLVEPSTAVASETLTRMLQSTNPKTRQKGIWGLSQRCDQRRSAPAELLPMLAVVLHDPDAEVRRSAIGAVRTGGRCAEQYADLLAGLAAGHRAGAGEQSITNVYQAIQALARLADPRWVEHVCSAVLAGQRPVHVLRGAHFSTEVLTEIRRWLATEPITASILSYALVEWGVQATPAVPELVAALPTADPIIASALLAIGHDDPGLVGLLSGMVDTAGSVPAAMAIHRITGDIAPLINLLRENLTGRRRMFVPDAATMSALSDLGDELAPLVPAASPHLTGTAAATHPQRDMQTLAARIVAAAGDPEAIKPTVAAVLNGGHTPARSAADLIADLAVSQPSLVADLVPALRQRLEDRWNRLSAARALTRLGTPVSELTTPLVNGVTDYAARFGLATILELQAVDTVPALQALLATDDRFEPTSSADDIVWADELLQDRVRAAIADLRQAADE
jgi:HEAT repeat protein